MKTTVINIAKFFLFFLMFPFIVGVTVGFVGEVRTVHAPYGSCFLWGMLAYTVMHLFFWKPYKIFHLGQRLVADLFRFFPPLSAVAQYTFPLYSSLLLILLYFSTGLLRLSFRVSLILMFFTGFALAMHVILTAEDFSDDNDGLLKANYLFTVGLSYIFVLILTAGLLSSTFSSFKFNGFWDRTLWASHLAYTFGYKRLFQ